MAAIETGDFWVSRSCRERLVYPPPSWTRIHAPGIIAHNNRTGDWLKTDEAEGEFCWHYASHVQAIHIHGTMWAFSDPVTAVAFKLRFG